MFTFLATRVRPTSAPPGPSPAGLAATCRPFIRRTCAIGPALYAAPTARWFGGAVACRGSAAGAKPRRDATEPGPAAGDAAPALRT